MRFRKPFLTFFCNLMKFFEIPLGIFKTLGLEKDVFKKCIFLSIFMIEKSFADRSIFFVPKKLLRTKEPKFFPVLFLVNLNYY